MFVAYEELYGIERAKQVCGRLPQVPLTGRWGSVSSALASVMVGGKEELPKVYRRVVVSKVAVKKRKHAQPGGNDSDKKR